MKTFKRITYLLAMLILTASFSHCSSAQKLQKEAPITFVDVYCQTWVAGIKGGGSGLNLFLPTNLKTYDHQKLDSVYFRGQSAKLEIKEGSEGLVYIGRFTTDLNQPKQDIILSSEQKDEYNNQMAKKTIDIPFVLNDDECVVSYHKEDKVKYFKVTNITQKEPLNYPSAPPNRQ